MMYIEEGKYFVDLTKVNVPFGLLDFNTQSRLRALMADGNSVEVYTAMGWVNRDFDHPHGNHAPIRATNVYREKLSMDMCIPWNAFEDNFRYAARDKNGKVWVFQDRPSIDNTFWVSKTGNDFLRIPDCIKYNPGNKDWKDSLIERP